MKQTLLFKKVFTLLLSAVLLVAACTPLAYADSPDIMTISADVAEKSTRLLVGLDIMTEATEQYDAAMSRADFAKILANMMRYSGFTVPDTGYRDVDAGTKNAAAVGFVIEQGYMTGAKGLFRPNDGITYAEAVRALVEVTGNNLGKLIKTDSAYMMKASGLGICKGISGKDGNAVLSVGAAAKMAANTLSANSMKMAGVEGGYISEVETGTFLNLMLSTKRVIGLLTKTRTAGIYSAGGTGGAFVELDEIRFRAEDDWSVYLGLMVEAYVLYSDSGSEILYMTPMDNNEVVELTSDDILSINSQKTKITYTLPEDEEKEESMELVRSTNVIFNGSFAGSVSEFTVNDLSLKTEAGLPLAGYIRLIDYDYDGVCDVLFVMSYETYYVSDVDARKEVVIDSMASKTLDFSIYREDQRVITYEDGTATDFSVFDKDQVLNIAASRDGRIIYVVISETELEDIQITEIRGDEYKINDVWYRAGAYFKTYFNQPNNSLSVGWTGTLKLDYNGDIAASDSDPDVHYGYILALSTPQGLSTDVEAKIFSDLNDEGIYKFSAYHFNDKVRLNYVYYDETKLHEQAVFKKQDQSFCDQLIRFTVNGKDEITSILTADKTNVFDTEDLKTADPDDDPWYNKDKEFALNYATDKQYALTGVQSTEELVGLRWRTGGFNPMGNRYSIDGETPLWVVPDEANKNDETAYAVTTMNTQFTNGNTYAVELYNVDEYGNAEHVLYRGGDASRASYTRNDTFFVSGVAKVVNADGEIRTEISGYNKPIYSTDKLILKTMISADETVLSDLEPGDLIQYGLNTKGEVSNKQVLFSYYNTTGKTVVEQPDVSNEDNYGINYALSDSGTAMFGKVAFASDTVLGLTFDNGATFHAFGKGATDSWLVFDTKTGKTTVEGTPMVYGLKYGIQNASEVCAFITYTSVEMGIIYVK